MNPCTETRPMIMSYLDGQLSEAQAAPLRKHLLECQPCRGSAQDQKNLTRWFTAAKSGPAAAVPRDFAARVARRAFQGDRGTLAAEDASWRAPAAARPAQERHLRFVMTLTAVAAALVMILSVAIRRSMLPDGTTMQADDRNDVVLPLDEAVKRLDQLNARDASRGVEARRP
jgi:anti-sigma factor RsiW